MGALNAYRKRDIACGRLNYDLEQARLPKLPSHFLLHGGDIILHAHLGKFTPIPFDSQPVAMTIAKPLIIIRIRNPTDLLPEYLEWYLQTSDGQQCLAAFIGQGNSDEVTIEGLYNFQLFLPALRAQRVIGGIYRIFCNLRDQGLSAKELSISRLDAINFENTLMKLARFG